MPFMLVTLDTSQFPNGWLKEEASANIECIPVTEETFQSPIGWLK